MKATKLALCAVMLGILSGCAVNVVTVNVTDSQLAYLDQGVSKNITESNVEQY